MSSRKHRKLKRHPIVRFIRGIFRLVRVLFRPKRTIARLELSRPPEIAGTITGLELLRPTTIAETSLDPRLDQDRLITVGEVFGGIRWQSSPSNIQKEFTGNSRISQPQDVSRN